ncbi:MAG: UDP-N-acetylmuramoylalanyl-D-glutamyl-2,6-diaminopimelate--D-alanyl-D-alanine ligase [Alphaproteobacteria bacterium]|nr:UDP-N-acetylmuramoylalanyl-D-glutamyl-2,6-diaminopimelate--D-alanyl-D-alanine ligase [Alphaproteobacteria bacterium]NCQ87461.1 UDP-N-acetylmuramoylalanyl-D-glutamyl-2,6-diaminopimelate--D-alanyl-D-alanine ligase [Alphaproteobacteria bacterium]NCT06332.1 UDP-N-acetylmuramoylalanyl-D-glutamyl-2,6-diaminopimelate--D-alanyl-D-alanine ligase [Alphaproteobacteria bacterium]
MIWTSAEAVKATGGKASGEWHAYGVSIDTRTVKKGDLFIALKGDTGNGHDYVAKAIENGAVCAVVSKAVEGVDPKNLLIVDDTLKAMQDLGRFARERTGAKVIGITGSVGKTGTKEMLATALDTQGQTHASIKSYNNHWGVPLSLSNMHAGTDFGIFEMGMNHPNEITPLTNQVKPHIAIITTIAPVHIEHFDNGLDGIVDAKTEIFDGVQEGGYAVLNSDIPQFEKLKEKALAKNLNVATFGENEMAQARLLDCLEAANGSRVKAKILDEEVSFTLQIAGRHIAQNAMAVLLAVKLAGADVQKAAKAIERQEPIMGRGKREKLDIGEPHNPITLIDESYNASPASMNASFKVLALVDPGRGGRRIAILGDMLELGKDSAKLHADLALPIKAAGIDLVYTCGKDMKNLHDQLPANQRGAHKNTSKELAEIVPDVLIPGDVVMVKGSLGSKMGVVVEALRALPVKFKKATNT